MSFWPTGAPVVDEQREVRTVRALAGAGLLADTYRCASAQQRLELRRGVYWIAAPVTYQRITLKLERGKRHHDCLRGLAHLRPDCLDRFHDACEPMVEYTLRKATMPVNELERWMSARITAVTINQHRVRRGERGAQQKPSVPMWLRRRLADDPWLIGLALGMLTWVGIPDTAGTGIWPLEAWAARRATVTGDPATSDPTVVRREIDVVLTAMRTRPDWYARYLQRPLDRKPVPLAPTARTEDGRLIDLPVAPLVSEHERRSAALLDLAAAGLDEITEGLAVPGSDPTEVVTRALLATFGGDHADPADDDVDIDALLSDPAATDRLVRTILTIVRGRAA